MTQLPYTSLAKFLLADVLRLIRSENVGVHSFFHLVKRFGSPGNALEAIPRLSILGGRKQPISLCSEKDTEHEMEMTLKAGARFVIYGSEEYPELLHQIYDPPPVIIVKGSPEAWKNKKLLAMVGARNCSANGFNFARQIARTCGEQYLTIVSGLARGIDTAAHNGALATGTVAVVAGGIDNIYPPENAKLFEQIEASGAIITEHAFGMAPHSGSLPSRNRIISGMSLGTLVVEASPKSGSLITARYALEQGREVFAVPGSPLDPRCKGTNGLIRNGAVITETTEDILQALPSGPRTYRLGEEITPEYQPLPNPEHEAETLHNARETIAQKLNAHPVLVDELLLQCHVSANLLWTVLLELELAGRLNRHPGGMVSLRMESTEPVA